MYNAQLEVVGYEVLYRSSHENRAAITDGNKATSQLLLNTFVELGLDQVVGDKLAFVNLTRDFLLGSLPLPLGTEQLVLEILEDVPIDTHLVTSISGLVEAGYTLALDDATFREELRPLLAHAAIVKVELPAIPPTHLAAHVRQFREYPVKLLAEKVETLQQFHRCKLLGFEYFQGFFLSRPEMMSGKARTSSQLAVLQLISRLSDPDVTVDEIERIIRNDAVLTYKLLRYINTARFALRSDVDSVRTVIILLGTKGVRAVAMLISLAGAVNTPGDMLRRAAERAIMCEALAQLTHSPDASSFFTAGLLSALDVVLEMPLDEILDSLPLSSELKNAVLHRQGTVGQALSCAIGLERADWPAVAFGDLKASEISGAYLSAITQADEMWAALDPR